ncbi:MAG: DMT family transporter [Deltaproteobacteria bacterium]|nr:DMT family transporter [Deltaproteobacteria bacterium]
MKYPEMFHAMKGYLCVALAAVMWASSGTAGKALFNTGVTPFELVQIRVTVSTVLLSIVFGIWFRPLFKIRPRDLWYFFLLGGVIMALVQITYFFTISKIQVAAAIFIQYLAPVFVAFFSILFWKECLTFTKTAALILSLGGCYLVVGGYNLHLLKMNQLGIMAGVLSALCFGAYTLVGEKGMHRYPPWTVLFYSFLFATMTWHVFYPPFHYFRTGFTAVQWGWIFYVSIVGTVLPFGLFFMGVNYVRSTRASITATLEPISAGLFAYLFLGEFLQPLQIAGGAMVVTAIVLLQLKKEQDELSPANIRNRCSTS